MKKRPEQAAEDDPETLFREAMAGVRPLSAGRARVTAPARPTRRVGAGDGPAAEPPPLPPADRRGVPLRTLQRLRRGRLRPEALLDLHGHTRDSARRTVERFLHQALADGRRCVLLIHGVGRGNAHGLGVLRAALPGWLDEHPAVLASSPAQPQDGGAGALYVLLRRAPQR